MSASCAQRKQDTSNSPCHSSCAYYEQENWYTNDCESRAEAPHSLPAIVLAVLHGLPGDIFMATSRKRLRSATKAGAEAQALASRMMSLQADAGLTIAMRMPILMKGVLGDSRGQREAAKAVTEKVSAVLESGVAATQATVLFWWGIALNPFGQTDLAEAAAKVANSTLEPFAKRTSANAARLSGSRR